MYYSKVLNWVGLARYRSNIFKERIGVGIGPTGDGIGVRQTSMGATDHPGSGPEGFRKPSI